MDRHTGPLPIYLLAGGPGARRAGGDPVLARALASSGAAHPTVAYIGAASHDNRAFFFMLTQYLRLCGAGEVNLIRLASRRAGLEKARAALEAADAVFVSGGDVEAGMQVLEERGIIPLLRGLYEGGKLFLGTSAGSIMLAQAWVRWQGGDGARASLFPCLGLAPILCDTHDEAEGWGELRTLLELCPPDTVGYGIPTGAGLAVHPDGGLEPLGGPVHRYVRRGQVLRIGDLA